MATRRKKRPRYQGHPAMVAVRKAKHGPPDARELERRQICRLVSEELARDPREGALVGPLAAAARYAAGIWCQRAPGLDDDEHRAAVANYFTEQLGDVIDNFDVIDYARWRKACNGNAR